MSKQGRLDETLNNIQGRYTFEIELPPPVSVEVADALEWLQGLNSETAHLVITDPPYDSLEEHRARGTTTRLTNEWFEVVDERYYRPLFLEFRRVMRRNAHGYCFCDQSTLPHIKDAVENAGLRWFKFLVWDKCDIGLGYHYRSQHELVAFFGRESGRHLRDRSIGDVLRYKRVRGGYPTQKPVELCQTFVTQSSGPGQHVIDPFCGSGTTGVAARLEGRTFAGCDVSKEAVETARARIDEVNVQGGEDG